MSDTKGNVANDERSDQVFRADDYVKVTSLAEAYELCQKRSSLVVGGMVWLKMGNRVVTTAIDLSGLGLDTITETEGEFVIGCMTHCGTWNSIRDFIHIRKVP